MSSTPSRSVSKSGMFQPMPDLTEEQYGALREDIEAHGVIVPVVVDQHGRTLDGHNRQRIATELGIECPTEVLHVADDDAAMDLALTLNCARRHLTREQTREVIRAEIERRPQDSDRAIARRVGCSPSTVGAVRKPDDVSKLDTSVMSREEAERRTVEIREHLAAAREHLFALVVTGLCNAIPATELVRALLESQRRMEAANRGREAGAEISETFRRGVYEPVIDSTLLPETAEEFRPHWDHETFLPMTEEDRRALLEGIANVGGDR